MKVLSFILLQSHTLMTSLMVCVMTSEQTLSGLLVSLYVHFVFPHLKLMAAIRVNDLDRELN